MTPDTHDGNDGRALQGDHAHGDGEDAKNAKSPPAHVHTRDDNDRTEEIFGHLKDDRFPRFAVIRNPTMMERAIDRLARPRDQGSRGFEAWSTRRWTR